MELNDYQKKAMSTRTESSDNFSYMAFGMVAEVGEIADKVAKAIRKKEAIIRDNMFYPSSQMDRNVEIREGLKKELGDVLWFVSGLADAMGWTLEEVAQLNLDKLADRQKRGVIVGNGDER